MQAAVPAVPAAAATDGAQLPRRTLVAYSLPELGVGFVGFLFSTYLVKYCADVLLVAPAALGGIFFAARLWDAISDPLAGYLSDRTRSRLGRRRPWLLASLPPLVVLAVLPWAPPASLEGAALVAWLALCVIGFETASTMFQVPHAALGAELSLAHHERTRVFGYRHVADTLGIVFAGAALWWIIEAEDKRTAAVTSVGAGILVAAALVIYAVASLRERPEHWGRGATRPFPAMADVWRNPHARLLLLVYLIQFAGLANLGALGPFYVQYVLGDESLFPLLLGSYFIPAVITVPLALPLARRFGKKNMWLASMAITGTALGSLFFVGQGQIGFLCVCGIGAGVGFAIASTVGPSVKADVIDYDELTTGERKEGAYFATWNFVRKCAGGITVWIMGMTLQLVGFEPNAEQSASAQLAIRVLFSGIPFVTFAIGFALFLRFRLTETEHLRIRTELDRRHERGRS